MNDKAAGRRLLDRFAGPPTVLAEGSRMVGDLVTPGALMMCGSITGDGDVRGALSIAKGANWEGEVRCKQAVIAGQLTGRLTVEGKLELAASAVIKGSVTARSVAIARGAVVDGEIMVTSGEPIVQFVEKRAALT
ncbi:MAG: polymer-forming cytoskeletal protein [Steroidobacteraceae bacterium]